jgi:hypothetical protein
MGLSLKALGTPGLSFVYAASSVQKSGQAA